MREIIVEGLRLIVPDTVYPPAEDSALMVRSLRQLDLRGKIVLDVGTGTGVLAIAAALAGAERVIATDINPSSRMAVEVNSSRYSVVVEFRIGDLFEPVQGETFDVVLFNPPYLPEEPYPNDYASLAWAGGLPRGRRLIDRFLAGLREHMNPNGLALLLQTENNGLEETFARASAARLWALPWQSTKVAFDRLWVLKITCF